MSVQKWWTDTIADLTETCIKFALKILLTSVMQAMFSVQPLEKFSILSLKEEMDVTLCQFNLQKQRSTQGCTFRGGNRDSKRAVVLSVNAVEHSVASFSRYCSLARFSGGGLLGGAGAEDLVAGSLSSCFTASVGGSGSFFTSTSQVNTQSEEKNRLDEYFINP